MGFRACLRARHFGSSLKFGVDGLGGLGLKSLVAEWIHFTLFGTILPTIKRKVYTFWGL